METRYLTKKTTFHKRQLNEVLTVPNMAVNLRKAISSVMANPMDKQLAIYSSNNPDVIDPYDLKMMSKLDRLRLHSHLREENKKQRETLENKVTKAHKNMEKHKAIKAKQGAEQKIKDAIDNAKQSKSV